MLLMKNLFMPAVAVLALASTAYASDGAKKDAAMSPAPAAEGMKDGMKPAEGMKDGMKPAEGMMDGMKPAEGMKDDKKNPDDMPAAPASGEMKPGMKPEEMKPEYEKKK
jgi:hypothetical protein